MTDQPSDPESRKSGETAFEGGSPEELLEEVTGFNYRSLRTLRDLFWRPERVFSAYVEGERTYTPSLRLWFSLTILLTVVTYFFGSHSDLFLNAYQNWPASVRDQMFAEVNGTLTDLARVQGEFYALVHSWVSGLASFSAILLIRLFAGPMRWAARMNITFALSTVGSAVAICLFPIMVQRPDLGLIMIPIMVVVYAVTFGRGAMGLTPAAARGRWWKGGLIAGFVALLMFLVGSVLFLVSLEYAISTLASG